MPRGLPAFNAHPADFRSCQRAGVYRGLCVHVVDGDTYDVLTDLGFHQYGLVPIRLRGADTPELNARADAERARARAAATRARDLLGDQPVLVRTFRDRRSFDRYVGDVYTLGDAAAQAMVPPTGPGDADSVDAGPFQLDGVTWHSVRDLLIDGGHAVAT